MRAGSSAGFVNVDLDGRRGVGCEVWMQMDGSIDVVDEDSEQQRCFGVRVGWRQMVLLIKLIMM